MYPQLNAIGIESPEAIERYSLRQEAQYDILKIYFHRQKGELFAKSVKFKFPRQQKSVLISGGSQQYRNVTEINRTLTKIIDELDTITNTTHREQDVKQKILGDLRHLEKVVAAKIAEIEADLEKL